MRRIGFVVNPIAGMGGRVGLKGTDGLVEEARERGAEPRAPDRGKRALEAIANSTADFELLAWDAPMGADVIADAGLSAEIIGSPSSAETTAADTQEAVEAFVEAGVDLIVFVGGDGTAVDVVQTLDALDEALPVLGVPAGVKVFSSVFGVTPEAAGEIAGTFDRTESREVADIDEDAYRAGEVRSQLRGIAEVPIAEAVQTTKQLGGGSVEGVVAGTIARMDDATTYFLGPGSTVGAIKTELGFDGSPLGVDVWRDGSVLVTDATEADLLDYLDAATEIIVSPVGGQGVVLGRGNQQFSPDVIRASGLQVVASRTKLDDLGVLRVDTGDPALDEELRGWVRVRIGRVEERMMQVV